MKIERNSLCCKDKNLINGYFRDKLNDFYDKIICGSIKCNALFCDYVVILKYVLKLYKNILYINTIYNRDIKIVDIIDGYSSKIYNAYIHVINKHEYLRYLNIFNDLCNNNNCEYNIRNRNNNNNNILDTIHHNIIHYKYNINNNKTNNKHNKFITQVNNLKLYDNGYWVDFHGIRSKRDNAIVKPTFKYSSIKQEILYPKLVSYDAWDSSQNKVNILSKTPQINKWRAKNDALRTLECNIAAGSIITKEHILAIILYTDDDMLCYKFRKAFRMFDDLGMLKQTGQCDVSNYANWGKSLFECVQVYGKNINNDIEYYHGLNKKFAFGRFVLHSKLPLSTSISIDIANNFMGHNGGMVITFKNEHSSPNYWRCLPVKMFSKFDYEDEILFFENAFIINGIYVDFKTNQIFENDLVKCYLLLDVILNAKRFNILMNESILDVDNQKQLTHFIKFIINDSNQDNPYYKYFSLCLQNRVQIGFFFINNHYILNAIKSNILIKELVSLLFDYNNINQLNPGIFFMEIERRFLKYHYSLYCTTCDPVSIKLRMTSTRSKEYHYSYLIYLNHDQTDTSKYTCYSLGFTVSFFIQDQALWFKCYVHVPKSLKVHIKLYLECDDTSRYGMGAGDIAGGNGAHAIFKILPVNLCNKPLTFKLSVILWHGKNSEYLEGPFFLYHSLFGM